MRRRHRLPALLLLVLHLAGCATSSWRPAAGDPRELIEADRPRAVRVTRPDGTQAVFEYPHIRRDTLFAATGPSCRRVRGEMICERPEVVDDTPRIGLTDVRSVETAGPNHAGRMAAGAAIAVVFYVILRVAEASQ